MLKRTEKAMLKVDRALDKSLEGVVFAKTILRYMSLDKTVTSKETRTFRSKLNKRLAALAKLARKVS